MDTPAESRGARALDPDTLDVWADPATERFATPATIITFIRTIASVTLTGFAIHEHSLKLLVIGLVVYWAGDSLDGQVARRAHHETRIGAVLDIMSDRFCAAAFYLGLAWLHPEFTIPVLIYLAEFMVIDCFLSIAFLHWKIRSPNYFYVIDRTIYRLNWSHPGTAVHSALFAVLLLVCHAGWLGEWAVGAGPWIGGVIASCLLVFKCWSLARLFAIGLPIPDNRGSAGPHPDSGRTGAPA
jgi:CDP-diacylglycerol--glycerol-3-phosphate 3-phosphatidyltransferase